ncbi:MAG: hypothetical protein BA864_06865 [Desulfuromonadales bacterium C00003093]|nr:MAG: hypothetical protein BA864_06865 [Desulfuromonadales bacterium C00003093]
MVRVSYALRDALTDALEDEEDCADAIQSAKETRKALIRDTQRVGLTPFMQPTAEYEDDEAPEQEETGEPEPPEPQGPRAGRGQ